MRTFGILTAAVAIISVAGPVLAHHGFDTEYDANKKVKLSEKYDAKLLTTPEKVATLIQPDWKWYNARKEDIDARVTKILKS